MLDVKTSNSVNVVNELFISILEYDRPSGVLL